jgi:hypothetical protein
MKILNFTWMRLLMHISSKPELFFSALQFSTTKPARMRGHGRHNHSAPLEGLGETALSKITCYPNTLSPSFLHLSFYFMYKKIAGLSSIPTRGT